MDYPNWQAWNTSHLRSEVSRIEAKVVSIQRSKDHHKQRATLSQLQSTLHAMKQTLKQRETEERKARAMGFNSAPVHALTPSAR